MLTLSKKELRSFLSEKEIENAIEIFEMAEFEFILDHPKSHDYVGIKWDFFEFKEWITKAVKIHRWDKKFPWISNMNNKQLTTLWKAWL